MNRLMLLALLLMPSLAAAQVKGVKLAHQDKTPLIRQGATAEDAGIDRERFGDFTLNLT